MVDTTPQVWSSPGLLCGGEAGQTPRRFPTSHQITHCVAAQNIHDIPTPQCFEFMQHLAAFAFNLSHFHAFSLQHILRYGLHELPFIVYPWHSPYLLACFHSDARYRPHLCRLGSHESRRPFHDCTHHMSLTVSCYVRFRPRPHKYRYLVPLYPPSLNLHLSHPPILAQPP